MKRNMLLLLPVAMAMTFSGTQAFLLVAKLPTPPALDYKQRNTARYAVGDGSGWDNDDYLASLSRNSGTNHNQANHDHPSSVTPTTTTSSTSSGYGRQDNFLKFGSSVATVETESAQQTAPQWQQPSNSFYGQQNQQQPRPPQASDPYAQQYAQLQLQQPQQQLNSFGQQQQQQYQPPPPSPGLAPPAAYSTQQQLANSMQQPPQGVSPFGPQYAQQPQPPQPAQNAFTEQMANINAQQSQQLPPNSYPQQYQQSYAYTQQQAPNTFTQQQAPIYAQQQAPDPYAQQQMPNPYAQQPMSNSYAQQQTSAPYAQQQTSNLYPQQGQPFNQYGQQIQQPTQTYGATTLSQPPPPQQQQQQQQKQQQQQLEKNDDIDGDELPTEDIDGAVLTEEMKARAKASHMPEEEASQGGQMFRELMARARKKAQQQQKMQPQQQQQLLQTLQPPQLLAPNVQVPPNVMDLSIEEQARLFREIMMRQQQQQQQQQPNATPYVQLQLPNYPYSQQSQNSNFLPPGVGYDGRKIGRNRDADVISTTADVYFAKLKRDSTTRNLARYAGDEAKANAVFHDPQINDIKTPEINPYMKEQREKERDMLETAPEEMLIFQEYEKAQKQEKSYAGISYKERMSQRMAQRRNAFDG